MKHILSKFLPVFGIGSATVDTKVSKTEIAAGSTIYGNVCIQGGKTEQDIKDIIVILKAEYIQRMGAEVALKQVEDLVVMRIAQNMTILPKQIVCLPFEMEIPLTAPVSILEDNVWLHTDVDVAWAISSEDRDYLSILPHPYMKKVLDALTAQMGFVLKRIETKDFQYVSKTPDYTQIFIFLPQGSWKLQCEKLKVRFAFIDNGVEAFFCKYDQQKEIGQHHIVFSHSDLQQETDMIARRIEETMLTEA